MSETIEQKCECPHRRKGCDYVRFLTFYDEHGNKEIIIPACFSNKHQEYARWVDFGFGNYKRCRKDLYEKMGKVNIYEQPAV